MDDVSIPRVDHFVGRRRELARLDEALRKGPVVLLTGDAGVGKTALAAEQAAREVAAGRQLCWCQCQPGWELASIGLAVEGWLSGRGAPTLVHVFADEAKENQHRLAALVSQLNRHGITLVLDDAHRFRKDEMGPFLEYGKQHLREGALLLVARPEGAFEEQREGIGRVSLSGWLREEAQSWICEVTGKPAGVIRLAELVDGHPLLLRLCLSLLAADGWTEEAVERLLSAEQTVQARFDVLLKTVEDSLTDDQLELLAACSIHRLPVDHRGLARVYRGRDFDTTLEALHDRRLIDRGILEGGCVHDALREYVLSHLPPIATRSLHSRCGAYYRDRLAEMAADDEARRAMDINTPLWSLGTAAVQGRMALWTATAVEAFHHTYEAEESQNAVDVLCSVSALMRRFGFNHELLNMIEQCIRSGFDVPLRVYLERARVYTRLGRSGEALDELRRLANLADEPGQRADVWYQTAYVHYRRSDFDKALRFYYKAIELRRDTSDRLGEADLLARIATILKDRGEYERARSMYCQALDIATGDESGMPIRAYALHNLARLHTFQGDRDRARQLHEEALTVFESLGDRAGGALTRNNLGNIARHEGDYELALTFYTQNLGIYEDLGDDFGTAFSARNVGDIHFLRGEFDTARGYYEESLALSRRIENRFGVGFGLIKEGNLFAVMGDFSRAEQLYEEAFAIMKSLGNRYGIAEVYNRRAHIEYLRGNFRQTLDLLRSSLSLLEQLGEKQGIAMVFHLRANVHRDRGEYAQAAEQYAKSLAIKEELSDRPGLAALYHDLANLQRERGEDEEADRYYASSREVRLELGDRPGLAALAADQADSLRRRGEYEKATTLYEESVDAWNQMGLERCSGLAQALEGIAMIRADRGEYGRARELFNRSLAMRRALEIRPGVAKGMDNLACLDALDGDLEKARDLHRRSLEIFRDLENKREIQKTLGCLANIARNVGDLDGAAELAEEAFRIAQRLGDRRGMAISLTQSALLEAAQDNDDHARILFETSLSIKRDLGDLRGVVATLLPLARTVMVLGQYGRAETLAEEARVLSERQGFERSLLAARLLKAEVQLRRDKADDAGRQVEAIRRLVERLDDQELRAQLLRLEGLLAFKAGDRAGAQTMLQQSRNLFASLSERSDADRVSGELTALSKDELMAHLERRNQISATVTSVEEDLVKSSDAGEVVAIMALVMKPLSAADVRERIGNLISEEGGRPFRAAGEALLIEFSAGADALRGAKRLSGVRLRAPEGLPVRPAVAIDCGRALRQGSELIGGPAGLVLRLVRLVPDGGVVVTERVVTTEDLGDDPVELTSQSVRDRDEPLRIYLMGTS